MVVPPAWKSYVMLKAFYDMNFGISAPNASRYQNLHR
jgi:hypothetical protein